MLIQSVFHSDLGGKIKKIQYRIIIILINSGGITDDGVIETTAIISRIPNLNSISLSFISCRYEYSMH